MILYLAYTLSDCLSLAYISTGIVVQHHHDNVRYFISGSRLYITIMESIY